MRVLNVKTYTAHLVGVAAAISLSLVAGCKSPTTGACKPGTVLVKVSCPAGAAGGELKVRVTDNQRVTEELSVGTCGGERSAFSAEFAFDDLKAVGALSATVKLVEGAAVLASTSSSPQLLNSQECLVLEPAWPLGTEDGGAIPVGGKGGGGTGGGDDGDAGIGGSGGVAPPPECQASDPPRSCLGAAGNCAKGTESCVAGKWGECSVKKATKDLCDVLGDDADCDGAPNKGCSCVPGEPAVCGPPTEQGICKKGKQACMNGTLGACAEAVYAKPRDCTSAGDNDCDGKIDNVVDGICQCPVGASQACQSPELAGTTCKPNTGTQTCTASAEKSTSAWTGCTGGVCISCLQGAACDLGGGKECRAGRFDCTAGVASCVDGGAKPDSTLCPGGSCKNGGCCSSPPAGCLGAGVSFCPSASQKATCAADANGCLSASPASCPGDSGTGVCTGAGVCSIDCSKTTTPTSTCACGGFTMPNPAGSGLPNLASYSDNGNGTVTDNVTGLVWERTVNAGSYGQAAAAKYCTDKGTGWRLPTRIELVSLVNVSVLAGPAIDQNTFPNTQKEFFWSSSPVAGGPSNSWGVSFEEGQTYAAGKIVPSRVRCVR